jgi:hypothetical protein
MTGTPCRRDDRMSTRDGYLFHEAGQAVAAIRLGLTLRRISTDPACCATEIVVPRRDARWRLILWLTGMAAENKGAGKGDPLRQMRTRQRVRTLLHALMACYEGAPSRRRSAAQHVLNQAQDRANAICSHSYPAIREVAAQLRRHGMLTGQQVKAIVAAARNQEPAASGRLTKPAARDATRRGIAKNPLPPPPSHTNTPRPVGRHARP